MREDKKNINTKIRQKDGIVVLSLCDGISCGQIALERAGIKVNKYYASEIKEIALKVTKDNYPNTIFIGNVNKITYKDGILHTEKGDFKEHFDLVMFGSPCQSFSIAMATKNRIGLLDKEKSGLFLKCDRILKEVNPKYFLVENVASMKNADRDIITSMLEVEPVRINSKIISPCLRDRYYWTNLKISMPQEKDIKLQDILTSGYTYREKGLCLLAAESKPHTTPVNLFYRHFVRKFTNAVFKSEEHFNQCVEYYNKHYKGMSIKDIPNNETDIFNGIRYLSQTELERCQTIPEGYTKCLTRNQAANVIGDGWTVDVISHILSFIKKY